MYLKWATVIMFGTILITMLIFLVLCVDWLGELSCMERWGIKNWINISLNPFLIVKGTSSANSKISYRTGSTERRYSWNCSSKLYRVSSPCAWLFVPWHHSDSNQPWIHYSWDLKTVISFHCHLYLWPQFFNRKTWTNSWPHSCNNQGCSCWRQTWRQQEFPSLGWLHQI